MSLKDKYESVLDLGAKLQTKGGDWKDEGGKLVTAANLVTVPAAPSGAGE